MENSYEAVRQFARDLVAKAAPPGFYKEYSAEHALSTQFFENNPVINEMKKIVADEIENDFGHGLHHSIKVAIDAGTLVIIECGLSNYSKEKTDRILLLVQSAGLLHDIKRKQKNHAVKSADFASEFLKNYSLSPAEITDVCLAIKSHEAFKEIEGEFSKDGKIISDCLYDADKFRWGPDNFTHTVWEMVSFSRIPLSVFVAHFPRGLRVIEKIKSTFRSKTGKKYGPEFIEIGTAIGNELFRKICKK